VQKVLARVPGLKVSTVQTSCCGMAGSFGYEAEHYPVSMKMAELSLLPEVRKRAAARIVADGTSCRQQIEHGAGREAWHVARFLDAALSASQRTP
jgi:Fe-S oxidoreductase